MAEAMATMYCSSAGAISTVLTMSTIARTSCALTTGVRVAIGEPIFWVRRISVSAPGVGYPTVSFIRNRSSWASGRM